MIPATYTSLARVKFYFCISFLLLIPTAVFAVPDPETQNNDERAFELNFELTKSDYQYQLENRPDPFVPFFTGESTKQPDPNEIIEVDEELTGMQLYEPGQLSLVALMMIKGQYYAMVEDFKGQGYIIEEGTKIGRRGIVKDIIPNKVLIEEVAMTRSGNELRNEIVMALRKEGEE